MRQSNFKAIAWSTAEVDDINVLQASQLVMRRAIEELILQAELSW